MICNSKYMTLLLLLCTQEYNALNGYAEMKFVSRQDQDRGVKILWIEQCVAKKEMGL